MAPGVAGARRAALERELARIVQTLAAGGALRIIVYGSFARDEIGPESDLDLLVVVPPDGLPFVERLRRVYALAQPVLPCDILPYTADELAALAGHAEPVATALREGREVYPRSGSAGV